MNGEYLLDTNAVIAVLEGDLAIHELLQHARETYIATAVLAELYYGAEKSGRLEQNLERIEDLVNRSPVLEAGPVVARWWGYIKNNLRKAGKPIPANDIWIAATAMANGLAMVTRDRHFDHVEDLPIVTW